MDTNEDSRQSRIPVNDLDWKLHMFVKVVRKSHENNKPRWLCIYHSVNDRYMTNIFNVYQIICIWRKKLERDINTTDQLHTGKAVIRWYGNKCVHLSSHQILIFYNILIPPCSFHIRTHVFHHAWLMTAILVHFMLQWCSSRVKKRPKPACDIQFLISKKSRLLAHLEQLSTSLVCYNRDFLTVPKILNNMYISGFVNTICGTKLCEIPKNKRNVPSVLLPVKTCDLNTDSILGNDTLTCLRNDSTTYTGN